MTKNTTDGKAIWVDPDDAPELTDEFFMKAEVREGNKIIRKGRGRPKQDNPKKLVTIRLDADLLDAFKAEGEGWQTRINSALRAVITEKKQHIGG